MKNILIILSSTLFFLYATYLNSVNDVGDIVRSSSHIESIDKIETQPSMIWVTEWMASDSYGSEYGKGRFYYRFARSSNYDMNGNYKYEVYFISDSYYDSYMYNSNNVYRCATKIDQVNLYVNGYPYINGITGSSTFWLIFQGDFNQGVGDLRIAFYNRNPNLSVYITWSPPIPF